MASCNSRCKFSSGDFSDRNSTGHSIGPASSVTGILSAACIVRAFAVFLRDAFLGICVGVLS